MKTKMKMFLALLLALIVQVSFAQQTRTITGTVTDEQGLPLPGVNIIIQGTATGVQTDFDGNYSINAEQGDILVFSFVGLTTAQYTVGQNNTINVQLEADAAQLDEVVVTALGIRREKKSLGYATQEVDGAEVSDIPTTNFMNSLSGKVAGLQVSSSGTPGGSSNIVIRGNASITGNNQALFVIDGVPISNETPNTSNQQTGRGGYDYGNLAADINPEDIASMNVLKGAAATALYGARAANGVIIIETKKGRRGRGVGISVNSSFMATTVDLSTFPTFQKEYGMGYGPFYPSEDGYFQLYDITGDGNLEETAPLTEDVSYGARFDPNRLIYQWNSIYPQLTETYLQPLPWVAGENDPTTFFETGYTAINSVSVDGGTDRSSFRLGFTNLSQTGNLPNSSMERNNLIFSASHDLTDRLTFGTMFNYTKTGAKGRYGTGYQSENPMQAFRQWWAVNVDVQEQRDAYFRTGENITWNPNSPFNLRPIYMDNPYFNRYENFNNDTRHRYFGNANLTYEINDVFSILGRWSFDSYYTFQEERRAVGSVGVSGYTRRDIQGHEFNTDIILNFNHNIFDGVNLDGNLGFNLRENRFQSIAASTNGGLNIPRFYALSNSSNPLLPPNEQSSIQLVDGFFGRVSLGFFDTYYIEGTLRRDRSSTLPMDNNTFWYPSVSTSVLLSNLFGDVNFLNYAKLRANYAEVGGDTNPYRVFNTFNVQPGFGGGGVAGNFFNRNNPNLRPETSKAWEVGLEGNLFDRRMTFDVSYYNTRTIDQITPVPVSMATGFGNALLNAGTMQNQGVEVSLGFMPVKTEDFSWNINVNWARNRNKVIELAEGIQNLQLAAVQGGVSINAALDQPYGAIRGTDYVYHEGTGQRIVHQTGNSAGYWMRTPNSNQIIGNIQPDWIGGVNNRIQIKNVSLNFLIDVQKGGDIFSLDTFYGYGTGAYTTQVGTNDLGNPIRNTIANGGGVILEGVTPDGQPNELRANASTYLNPWGWARNSNRGHVYDASFVKLREAGLTYSFTDNILGTTPFTNASISLIGRNLWIIHKNIPFSDPEAGLSAGNIQGYQSGAYPAVREIGASLKFNF